MTDLGPNPQLPVEQRVGVALDLFDLGVKIMRQNLVRRHPGATAEKIDDMLKAWMRDRPLDGAGVPSNRFSG